MITVKLTSWCAVYMQADRKARTYIQALWRAGRGIWRCRCRHRPLSGVVGHVYCKWDMGLILSMIEFISRVTTIYMNYSSCWFNWELHSGNSVVSIHRPLRLTWSIGKIFRYRGFLRLVLCIWSIKLFNLKLDKVLGTSREILQKIERTTGSCLKH